MRFYCQCCGKVFETNNRKYCNSCVKKIKRIVRLKNIRQHPFYPWKWNTSSIKEVDEIVRQIQSK